MAGPGTWRESDGSRVQFSEAKTAWADASRPVLLGYARRYHDTIRYEELATEIQGSTGVFTRMLLPNWIGKVLEAVAFDCHRRGEPLLTALCVHADGTVGAGYAHAVRDTKGSSPEDVEMHAALERLECHKFFGAEIPQDGGNAALTNQELDRRARARRRAAPDRPLSICPTCNLALPLTGQCDNCS